MSCVVSAADKGGLLQVRKGLSLYSGVTILLIIAVVALGLAVTKLYIQRLKRPCSRGARERGRVVVGAGGGTGGGGVGNIRMFRGVEGSFHIPSDDGSILNHQV